MEDIKTLSNWDVRERLKINKCKAHRLLKKVWAENRRILRNFRNVA